MGKRGETLGRTALKHFRSKQSSYFGAHDANHRLDFGNKAQPEKCELKNNRSTDQPTNRLPMTIALWPPNPNELFRKALIFIGRGVCGT